MSKIVFEDDAQVSAGISAEDVATAIVLALAARDTVIAGLLVRVQALEANAGASPHLDGYINIKRAAGALGVSYATVRRRCLAGQLSASKDRGQWRVKL